MMELQVPRLVAGLRFVSHAAAPDDHRPILATVLLEGTESGLYLVAADNYRIARACVDEQDWSPLGRRPLAFDEVPVVLAFVRGRSSVGLTLLTGPYIEWSTDDGRRHVVTRLVDGRWPDYQAVIPKEAKNKLIAVNPRLLAEALARSKGAKGVTTRIYVEDELKPALIVTGDGENEYLEVVMPLRTGDRDDAWYDLARRPKPKPKAAAHA